jgi:hypothetical protein
LDLGDVSAIEMSDEDPISFLRITTDNAPSDLSESLTFGHGHPVHPENGYCLIYGHADLDLPAFLTRRTIGILGSGGRRSLVAEIAARRHDA